MASTASPHHKIGFLGPAGTFTEQALISQADLAAATREPMATIAGVLQSANAGDLDFGFVPFENALEGQVSHTIDTLAFSADLLIQREVDLPISMELLANPGVKLSDITHVSSHPMAFGQCRDWLTANLPGAENHTTKSTADAVRDVGETKSPTMAALANSLAGSMYGLVPLASDIGDHSGNLTRFVLVGRDGIPAPTGHDKTSIVVFQRADRPGSLLGILAEFAARSINLSKLASRPTKARMGDYCFVLDLDGHISDELVADALRTIHAKHGEIKFLGSYPAVGDTEHETRIEATESAVAADAWMRQLRSSIEADQ